MAQVPAATRTLRVLRYLASQPDPVPLDAIARACELPRSSAYHLVTAMVAEGFVVHLADEHRYGLGVAAFEVGSGYARQAPLQRIARRPLAELVDRTRQSAHLAVLHGRDVLYVLEERAPGRPPLVTDVGVRLPAPPDRQRPRGARAPARARRCGRSTRRRRRFVDRHGTGPRTLERAAVRCSTETRQRGYAVEDRRGHARAVQRRGAVLDHNDHPLAGVAVTYERGGRPAASPRTYADRAC